MSRNTARDNKNKRLRQVSQLRWEAKREAEAKKQIKKERVP